MTNPTNANKVGTSEAVPPSTCTVVYEEETYLSFPAIARAGHRLVVIFRQATTNELDLDAKLLICRSEDDGRTWSDAQVWIDELGVDSRNCGGGQLPDGTAHFVYDMEDGRSRPTYYRTSTDDITWSDPIRLVADVSDADEHLRHSVGNRAIGYNEHQLYFPHNAGNSVLVDMRDGSQTQLPRLPRHESSVVYNRQGELIAISKGGVVDVSRDGGRTWIGLNQIDSISQPDLLRLNDGRLLFCYSDKRRANECLLISEDGHDLDTVQPLMIFHGTPDLQIDSRGKAESLEHGEEILTVLYEASGDRGPGRIYLVRTPKSALDIGLS